MLGEILENTRMFNSRIRRLEHETERSRTRDLDIPIGMLHEQAMEMAKAGVPIEMLMDRFGNRLPKTLLKELITINERSRSGE